MTSLAQKLSTIVGAAFEALDLPHELGAVRVSDRPDLAQFQCNGAMAAAKLARKNPREVAQGVVDVLEDPLFISDNLSSLFYPILHNAKSGQKNANQAITMQAALFKTLEIAGPGFINFNVTDDFIAGHLSVVSGDDRLGIPQSANGETVVLDYGGMNVAKAMHVGHLRSLAIGDCLKRMMRVAGYDALGDIHMGDWGLQMGQIISAFEIAHPGWPYFDPGFEGDYPADAPFSYDELEEIYPRAAQGCKDDPERLDAARKATMELQDGRRGYLALWQHFIDLSLTDIKANIARLGVDFEIWNGEACVNYLIPEITADLAARGVTEDSEGAVVIPVVRPEDKKEMPPLLFKKSDGAATYGTTDVATIYDRIKTYPKIAKMIYETDLRQNLHFEQVFCAAEKAGYVDGIELKHIGHGTVNGPDGKPFKTREGKAMKFSDMVTAVMAKAEERLAEANLDETIGIEERGEIARMVAVATLKFTELSNQAHMDYIFDIDRMTQFEGKTGPYLLYQAVRIKSLLRKAEAQGFEAGETPHFVIGDEDRSLALLLTELPDHFEAAMKHYTPHVLCEYAYTLAQGFSSFYGNCHILSEENAGVRASRLALCALTYRQLEFVLNVLGIDIPERM